MNNVFKKPSSTKKNVFVGGLIAGGVAAAISEIFDTDFDCVLSIIQNMFNLFGYTV